MTIIYDPTHYSTEKLPKVSNLTYTLIRHNNKDYIHLSWDKIPDALGYRVTESLIDSLYLQFQTEFGGPMSKTNTNYFDIPIKVYGDTRYFGVYGIQVPYDEVPEIEELTLITVEIPDK